LASAATPFTAGFAGDLERNLDAMPVRYGPRPAVATNLTRTNLRAPFVGNEDGPNISGQEDDQRVQYAAKRVMHHVPIELPTVYFQFNADDVVASFTVNV
jgi:hypothetical protein